MNEANATPGDSVSAFIDGYARGDDCANTLNALLADSEAVKTWHAYHVVGDVLRSAELAPTDSGLAFLTRLEARLAQEPSRPYAADEASFGSLLSGVDTEVPHRTPSVANAVVFRWKALAATACTALVAVVGLGVWTQSPTSTNAQVAVVPTAPSSHPASPQVASIGGAGGAMLRDPQLDELMAAHRQLGGHSALQVPAGFLRNATYEGAGR